MHSNASNLVQSVWICIWMLWIAFKWLEVTFGCFEFGSIFQIAFEGVISFELLEFAFECLHLNVSNLVRIVQICIRVDRIPFQWLEYAFECFKSLLNALNLVGIVGISIWMVRIPFNIHSNASNLVRSVRICIWMLRIPFKWLEVAFGCFKFGSNGLNCIQRGQISFELLEFAFECFLSRSNSSNLHSNG